MSQIIYVDKKSLIHAFIQELYGLNPSYIRYNRINNLFAQLHIEIFNPRLENIKMSLLIVQSDEYKFTGI